MDCTKDVASRNQEQGDHSINGNRMVLNLLAVNKLHDVL